MSWDKVQLGLESKVFLNVQYIVGQEWEKIALGEENLVRES
jgi:hypothetical protein